MMRFGQGSFSLEVKNQFGTVYTPLTIVKLTINEAFKLFTGDHNIATFCDPACGDGNFLITIYQHLTSEISDTYRPVDYSLHVLRRIYGVDILSYMIAAAKERLLLHHTNLMIQAGLPANTGIDKAIYIVNQNIIHGNSLRSESDTWNLMPYEGGLCPLWFRDMKFNIIVGNPPYTSYKSHRPKKYCKLTNLAASFWIHCYNHITIDGVYSLNIKAKLLDGNDNARKLVIENGYVLTDTVENIIYNNLTESYSKDDGGSLKTMIITGRRKATRTMLNFNGMQVDWTQLRCDLGEDINKRTEKLLTLLRPSVYQFPVISISKYATQIGRDKLFLGHAIADDTLKDWSSTLVVDHIHNGPMTPTLCYNRLINARYANHTDYNHNQIKFCHGIPDLLNYRAGTAGASEMKYLKFKPDIDLDVVKLIWVYMNSTYHMEVEIARYASSNKKQQRVPLNGGSPTIGYEMSWNSVKLMNVPDITRLYGLKLQALLKFADDCIQSNDIDKYCNNVDLMINNLLFG